MTTVRATRFRAVAPGRVARGAVALALSVFALAGCHKGENAAQAGVASDSVVAFAAGSPSLQYIGTDTVRTRTEKVVAELAAQLVLDEDHTSRVSSPVDGRVSRMTRPSNALWRGKSRSARDADDCSRL